MDKPDSAAPRICNSRWCGADECVIEIDTAAIEAAEHVWDNLDCVDWESAKKVTDEDDIVRIAHAIVVARAADAAPRQPEVREHDEYLSARERKVAEKAAPKSEPEGPQDLTETEIDALEKYYKRLGAKAVAEIRRRRAQPANAAPLDALRRALEKMLPGLRAMEFSLDCLGASEARVAENLQNHIRAALAAAPRDRPARDVAMIDGELVAQSDAGAKAIDAYVAAFTAFTQRTRREKK